MWDPKAHEPPCLHGAEATVQVASHYLTNPGRLLGPLAGVCGTPEVISIRFSRRNWKGAANRSFWLILGIFSRVPATKKVFSRGFRVLYIARGAGGAPDAVDGATHARGTPQEFKTADFHNFCSGASAIGALSDGRSEWTPPQGCRRPPPKAPAAAPGTLCTNPQNWFK